MKWFFELFKELSETGTLETKQNLIRQFFSESDPDEKMRGLFLLSGRKMKRPVSSSVLRQIITKETGIGSWLLEESEKSTGNLAETLTLLIDDPDQANPVTLAFLFDFCEKSRSLAGNDLSGFLMTNWQKFTRSQRLLANHLLCGSFKSSLSSGTMIKLFAKATHLNHETLLHNLSEKWHPDSLTFSDLSTLSEPHPPIFFPVPIPQVKRCREFPPDFTSMSDCHAEWQWSGSDIQLVKFSGKVIIFDQEGSPVQKGFTELFKDGLALPDGTILAGTAVNRKVIFQDSVLSKTNGHPSERIHPENKKNGSVLICSDIFAVNGHSLLNETFQKRRLLLENCIKSLQSDSILISEPFPIRSNNFTFQPLPFSKEGILIKSLFTSDLSGWLLLPVQQTIKAVLIYAQATQDSIQGMYNELTVAIWKEGQLVSVAKLKNTLSTEESKEISTFIKTNTLERFGPVRTVKPELIFEIGFDAGHFSNRHKTGLVLKEPVLKKWLKGAGVEDVESLQNLEKMAKKSLRIRDTEA